MVAFTVLVVVSLTVTGIIGGEGSRSEQDRILQEIVDDTGIATSSRDIDHPPQRDLRLGTCERDPASGELAAGGTLTNYLDEPADYQLTVVFRSGSGTDLGAELARVELEVAGVQPERSKPWRAGSGVEVDGDFTCRVVVIERSL